MLIVAIRQMPQLRIGFDKAPGIVQVAVVREKSWIHVGWQGLIKLCTEQYPNLDNCQ
ncbi:MAG: hypothetical protein OXG51_06025 [Gammaproteobacteria bacterium]|nr:hypothetical protein [Gammaproteobacteria bacterium]